MLITDPEFNKFEQIWRKENPGAKVSREELLNAANKLLRVVSLIYGPDDIEGMGL